MDRNDPLADLRAEIDATPQETDEPEAEAEKPAAKAPVKEAPQPSEPEPEEEEAAEGDESEDEDDVKPKGKGKTRGQMTDDDRARARINAEVAKRHKERSEKEEVERENADLRKRLEALERAQKGEDESEDETPEKLRERIRAEEREKLRAERQAEEFNAAANKVFDQGAKAYGEDEFKEATAALQGIGMNDKNIHIPMTIVETSRPEKVIYLLSQDLGEAERIFRMPVHKMAIALEKLAVSGPNQTRQAKEEPARVDATKPRVSNAPTPPKPVRGGDNKGDPDIMDDRLDMEDFVAQFDKIMAKSR